MALPLIGNVCIYFTATKELCPALITWADPTPLSTLVDLTYFPRGGTAHYATDVKQDITHLAGTWDWLR